MVAVSIQLRHGRYRLRDTRYAALRPRHPRPPKAAANAAAVQSPRVYPFPMTDLFLHNPRCSKSRSALALVREAGVELPVREYLRGPLSVDELRRIVRLLGVRPIEIVRRGEAVFAELGLGDGTADEEVLRAMAEHPILIERPIVVRGGWAVVGRPPAASAPFSCAPKALQGRASSPAISKCTRTQSR